MRIADMQLAVPMILLALLIVSLAGPSLRNLIFVLALTSWVRYARVVRAQVLSLRSRDFIMAARAIDASALRIILIHILPNVLGAIVVVGTLELARAILLESSLSFLGMGVQPPTPSWGRMLAEGRTFISSHWWIATFPGLAIALTVLSINLIGDQLRDYSDPTLRKAFK
jgi:peptide/nickel transport system permease protein